MSSETPPQQHSFDLRNFLNGAGQDQRDGRRDSSGQRHEGRNFSGHHSRPEQRQRDRDHGQSGPHQLPEQGHHDEYTPHPVMNQILSLIHQGLLQGCVSVEALILSEQNPMLHADMQSFLQESGLCLYDAFQRIGLVQNTDGSWSAPKSWSLLSSFPAFFASVVGAFSNSIFQFLNAKLEMRIVNVDGVKTRRYAFETSDRKIVSALGALFYSRQKKSFLMQFVPDEKSGKIRLTDFGGKVDSGDNTIIDSLRREVSEETNRVFPAEYDFLQNLVHFYLEKCKYLLLICQAPPEFESIDPSQFGTSEDGSSIKRTVEWVSVEDFLRATNLHPRLSISPEVKETVMRLFSSPPH